MVEPLGLVPQRREGTGAAQILQPFNSAPIFAAYDQSRVQPKRPLLDSFGKDLNTGDGKVHPNDRWWIKEASDKYWDAATKVMAKVQAERRDLNAEEQRILTELKQDVADRVGVAQKQYEGWNTAAAKVAEAPYAYNEAERKAFDNYFNTKITDRPLFPGIGKTPETDIVKWIEGIGNPTVSKRTKTTTPNGRSVEVDKTEFDPKKASELFNTTVSPLLTTTQQGRILMDVLKANIIDQDPSFTSLPIKDQTEIVEMAARDYYVNTKKNQYQYKNEFVRDDQASKTGGSGGDKKPTISDLEPVVDRKYVVYDRKTGERRAGVFDTSEPGTTLQLNEVISYPVAGMFGSKVPGENKEFNFFYKGQNYSGSPQNIRQYRGKSGKWSNYYLMLVNKDGIMEEIPLLGENLKKVEKEFGFSLAELDKKFPDLKKQAEELPEGSVEDIPEWNMYNDAQKAIYREAYARRFGKTAPATAPAQQGAASKYIQQYGRK